MGTITRLFLSCIDLYHHTLHLQLHTNDHCTVKTNNDIFHCNFPMLERVQWMNMQQWFSTNWKTTIKKSFIDYIIVYFSIPLPGGSGISLQRMTNNQEQNFCKMKKSVSTLANVFQIYSTNKIYITKIFYNKVNASKILWYIHWKKLLKKAWFLFTKWMIFTAFFFFYSNRGFHSNLEIGFLKFFLNIFLF